MDDKQHYSRSYNHNTGITYVYLVEERYYDKDKKQSRNKRKLVGKIDPVTKQMVPTGKRGRPRGSRNKNKSETAQTVENTNVDYRGLYAETQRELKAKDQTISNLCEEMQNYATLVQKQLSIISSSASSTSNAVQSLSEATDRILQSKEHL